MKNTIRYYYNFNESEYYEYDNYAILVADGEIFAFKQINIGEDYLKYIVDTLNTSNIKINKIIINKDNRIFTEFNGKNYVLMKIIKETSMDQFEIFSPILINNNDNIASIWEEKVDNYMLKVSENGLNREVLLNTFNYYVGMAENAISIYNRTNKSDVRYVVSHRRFNYPITYAVFLDPTNLLIDTISRDISEYIKVKFFRDEIDIKDVRKLVNKYHLNNDEMNCLLARLLYPSYYFDALDISIQSNNDEKLESILTKIISYEKFLKSFYTEFVDYQLFIVDWIKK